MWIALAILIVLALATAVLKAFYKPEEKSVADNGSCSSCSGFNEKCEQECVMEASTKEIEYFDDEELDVYRNRPSNAYTDEEAAEFADVLYTMRQEEVKDWNRSLILRGINLPDQIKDEVIMLIEG
ncbi:MAG: FeoB-associated Cys-rich membrane protein [Prevotellaceae bacterium]|nr:FeoB-associated Cys-rich membrane protein [Prevotellaceae bacterium]